MAHRTIKNAKSDTPPRPNNFDVALVGTQGCPHAAVTETSVEKLDRVCASCSRSEAVGFNTAEPLNGLAPVGVIGLSHRTAPQSIRDKASFLPDAVPAFIQRVLAGGVAECAVLSTCNRTEIYYAEGSAAYLVSELARHAGLSVEELSPYLVDKRCVCAACHLFRVVSGLESAVLGETEIVAQVKHAWRVAESLEAAGSSLRVLFQRSLEASKRVRTESELCRNVTATGTLAVRLAEREVDGLAGKRVTVLGAGKISERVAQDVAQIPDVDLTILNRTASRAENLAETYGAKSGTLDELPCELVRSDAIIAALSVDQPVVTQELIASLQAARQGRKLAIVDLGAPQNVGEIELEDVVVIRLEDLKDLSEQNAQLKLSALPKALDILDEEVSRYVDALAERAAAPTIRALIQQGERIRRNNLKWAHDRLPDINDAEMKVIEEMARRMMIGLLEAPIAGLKGELSAQEHRHMVHRLFALEGGEGEA